MPCIGQWHAHIEIHPTSHRLQFDERKKYHDLYLGIFIAKEIVLQYEMSSVMKLYRAIGLTISLPYRSVRTPSDLVQ